MRGSQWQMRILNRKIFFNVDGTMRCLQGEGEQVVEMQFIDVHLQCEAA